MIKSNMVFTVVAFVLALLAVSQQYLDNTFWFLNLTNYKNFSLEDIPDMHDKIVLVTGANAGLGYISTLELARKGARIIMACRSERRAKGAMEIIEKELGAANLDFVQLDLGDYQSTARAVTFIKHNYDRLDVIIANAGVEDVEFLRLDGMERPMRINHLGHFQLVTGLEELILAATNPRVVVLSSNAHRLGGNVFDDTWNQEIKAGWFVWQKIYHTYGRSKLANILFARELQSRFNERNKNVFVNAAHPGGVRTEMSNKIGGVFHDYLFGVVTFLTQAFLDFGMYSVEDGVLTQLYLASSPEVVRKGFKGEYFVPHGINTVPSKWASDKRKQRELWEWSEAELLRLSQE